MMQLLIKMGILYFQNGSLEWNIPNLKYTYTLSDFLFV